MIVQRNQDGGSLGHESSVEVHIGVNISERKSGTERTKKRKKRKKRALVFFHRHGALVVHGC